VAYVAYWHGIRLGGGGGGGAEKPARTAFRTVGVHTRHEAGTITLTCAVRAVHCERRLFHAFTQATRQPNIRVTVTRIGAKELRTPRFIHKTPDTRVRPSREPVGALPATDVSHTSLGNTERHSARNGYTRC
jgi:hypothetical protein